MIGWEYHGEPADMPGLEVVAAGTAWQGGENPQQLDGHDLPRAQGELRLQRLDHLLVPGPELRRPGHTLPWSHWSRPHGPDDRVQQITRNLLKKAGCSRATPAGD